MKYYSLITFLLISCATFSQGYKSTQRQVEVKPSNKSLYGVEYELKHYAFGNGDSTLLDSLNLEEYISERQQSEDVEIYLPAIDQTLVLYSFERIEAKYLEKFGQ